MKKLVLGAVAAIAASVISLPAHAVIVLDFAAEAAGNERGITNGSTITNFQGTGVDVTFTAGANPEYSPYFDDINGLGDPAGLGVCKNLDDNAQCNPGGDDNVSVDETITVGFSDNFSLGGISFRDATHMVLGVPGNDGNVLVDVGAGFIQYTFSQVILLAGGGAFNDLSEITFAFLDTQFYIESLSDVPIPGAIPLLLSGLAGLGFASRRKQAAA